MRVKQAIKIVITALLLWLAFRTVDLGVLVRLVGSIDPLWLGGALFLTMLIVVADGLLFASVLRIFSQHLSSSSAILYSLVGWFFSNVGLSTFGGDVFRGVQLSRAGTPVAIAVRAVLTMRLVSLAALIPIMLFGFPLAMRFTAHGQEITILAGTVATATAALILVYFFAGIDRRLPIIARLGLSEKLMTVSNDFRRLLSPDRDVLTLWLLALVQHLLRVAILAALAAGLGLGISLEILFALIPAALLIAMIPISFGGWGVREVAFVLVLGMASVGATAALSLSIAFGALRLIVGAIGGLAWVLLNETHFGAAAPKA